MELGPSRLLAGGLLIAHGLAVAAVWVSLAGWPRYFAWAGILASLAVTLARALLLTGRQPVALELREDGGASWKDRRGEGHEGSLGRRHFVSPFLVVLELESQGRRPERVLVPCDSAVEEDFRRLRVWLRWRRSAAVQKSE